MVIPRCCPPSVVPAGELEPGPARQSGHHQQVVARQVCRSLWGYPRAAALLAAPTLLC